MEMLYNGGYWASLSSSLFSDITLVVYNLATIGVFISQKLEFAASQGFSPKNAN